MIFARVGIGLSSLQILKELMQLKTQVTVHHSSQAFLWQWEWIWTKTFRQKIRNDSDTSFQAFSEIRIQCFYMPTLDVSNFCYNTVNKQPCVLKMISWEKKKNPIRLSSVVIPNLFARFLLLLLLLLLLQTSNRPHSFSCSPLALFAQGMAYFRDLTNAIDWLLAIFALIFLTSNEASHWSTSGDYEWQLGVLAIFLSWFNLMLFLRR